MSVRNGTVLFLALSTLVFLVACGNSPPKVVPPPSGGFSNSNLNGTYVFSSTGVDAGTGLSAGGFFLTIVGAFVANGNGGITEGTLDLVSADPTLLASTNQAINNSSYHVTADGRGQATLNTALGPIGLDFVLLSSSHGLVTEFDNSGTGSGTIDLQPSAVSQSALSGLSYSFGVAGTGPGPSYAPYATAGSITLNSTGGVTVGIEDSNNAGTPTLAQAISTSSFVTVGAGTAPGTAQLTTTTTYSFDVYAIDSTHLKFIETDGVLFLSGDAYAQGTSIPSGTLAFTMAGFDTSGSPLGAGGFLPTSSGGTITAGMEDFNDGGNVDAAPVTVGGSFGPLTGGRSVLSLTGFVNGAANDVPGNYTFAAYPFTSNGVTGVQLLEIDSGITNAITAGTAFLQTSTSLAASQGYGFSLSAINAGNGTGAFEEDDIAEFTTTGSGFTGIVDINDEGGLSFDQAFSSSTYNPPDSSGRGTAITTEHGNAFVSYNFYVVNGSTVLLLETDSNQIGTGIFELQNGSGSPGAQPGISMFRPAVPAHAAMRHK